MAQRGHVAHPILLVVARQAEPHGVRLWMGTLELREEVQLTFTTSVVFLVAGL